MAWSSEAFKLGLVPKNESTMTEKDWFEFRNSLDPDIMGFDGIESYSDEESLYESDEEEIVGHANAFNIYDNLTTKNFTNSSRTTIKYIVIHYTANNGDTAKGNTNYFKSTYRGASAHYFVDENVIYRCVKDEDISWHCGGGLQGSNGHSYYKICTNSNSIGIEMCSRKYSNGSYYFKEQTVVNCALLVKYLMDKYNISSNNVIRHYDVTGKICPKPFVDNHQEWIRFKSRLKEDNVSLGIYKVVNCDSLNVRQGPSTSYDIKYKLKRNEEVEVIAVNNKWAKIKYTSDAYVSLDYLQFCYKGNHHWAKQYVDFFKNNNIIQTEKEWVDLNSPINKAMTLAIIDKATGGTWTSYETNPSIHWAQPYVISLVGKGVIQEPAQWIATLNDNLTKALLLALVCKATGGISSLYVNRVPDHWGRNCLDTLCDRGIINTPSAWTTFDMHVDKGSMIALLYKWLFNGR